MQLPDSSLPLCGTAKLAWPYRTLPFLYTLRTYGSKQVIIDIPAGITQAVLHIPQGMAYALLAGVEPIYGLYVSIIPSLIYFLFSSTKHLSIGTFAVVSILCQSVLNKRGLLPEIQDASPGNHNHNLSVQPQHLYAYEEADMMTEITEITVQPSVTAIQLLTTLSLLVGSMIFAMGLLRIGSFSRLLSPPLVSAFTCAAALHVACSQLPPIFGISVRQLSGPLSLPLNLWSLAHKLVTDLNWKTFGFSSATIATLVSLRYLLDPICRRFPWIPNPPPIELLCIILSTWIVYYFDLHVKWHLATLGNIPAGLPRFEPPDVVSIVDWPLVIDALLIAFLITAITLSLVKLYAPEQESSQPNRQLVALGMSNMIACCFGCFPSAPSLSRSSVLRNSANCTPMANVYSSAILILVLLYLGPLFSTLPKINKFIEYANDRRLEAFVWIATYIPTVLFDLYIGFVCGLSASLIHLIYETCRSKSKQNDDNSDAEVEQIP